MLNHVAAVITRILDLFLRQVKVLRSPSTALRCKLAAQHSLALTA